MEELGRDRFAVYRLHPDDNTIELEGPGTAPAPEGPANFPTGWFDSPSQVDAFFNED